MSNCTCGSELVSFWYYDGHGIELFKGCPKCEAEKHNKYRPDIKTQYVCEETIEPESDLPIDNENKFRNTNRLNEWEKENQ